MALRPGTRLSALTPTASAGPAMSVPLVNRAISAGVRERRSVPVDDMGPVVEASCFDAGGTSQAPPEAWADQVDDKVIAAKISARILSAIDELPLQQREVVTLREASRPITSRRAYRRWRDDETAGCG